MAIRDVVNILLNKKVSKWFVIAIFFINLLSVFIVYIGLNELYKRDIKETELLCGNLTQALSQNIENLIGKINLSLTTVTTELGNELYTSHQIDTKRMVQILRTQKNIIQESDGISIVNADGDIIFHEGVISNKTNISDREYFQELKSSKRSKLVISSVIKSRITGNYVIVFARPFYNENGYFSGVVRLPIQASFFENLISGFQVGKDGVLALRDGDLNLVSLYLQDNPSFKYKVGSKELSPTLEAIINKNVTKDIYTAKRNEQDIERIYSVQKVGQYQFYAIAGISKADKLLQWSKIRDRTIFLLLVFLFVLDTTLFIVVNQSNALKRSYLLNYKSHLRLKHMLTQLRISDKSLKASQDAGNLGTYEIDFTSGKWTASQMQMKIFGIDDEFNKTIHNWDQLIYENDRDDVQNYLYDVIRNKKTFDKEYRIMRPNDGKLVWVQGLGKIEFDAMDQPVRMYGTIQDISSRKMLFEQLSLSQQVLLSLSEGIMVTDTQGTIQEVNPAQCHLTGYDYDELIGCNPRILSSGIHDSYFYQNLWFQLIKNGSWNGEITNKKKDGTIYIQRSHITAIKDSKDNIIFFVAISSDITVIKENQKQIEFLAYHDKLTSLPNRVSFSNMMRYKINTCNEKNELLGVGYIDIDNFKPINDNWGHHIGNLLLIQVSKNFQDALSENSMVARLGGDEFVILFTGFKTQDEIIEDVERVMKLVACTYYINDIVIELSVSIGVAIYPLDFVDDPDELLRHADQAMYLAKRNGKNCVKIFDSNSEKIFRQQQNEYHRIEQALHAREFCLYYQPKIDIHSNKTVGVEALIRWKHPEKGLLSPAQFLPIIETSELTLPIGEWILSEALQQKRIWQQKGIDISISINIFAKHLQHPDFFEKLIVIINNYPDIDLHNIEFEILETTAMENLKEITSRLNQCRQLGIKISLDDFGTGFSSLTYLRQLPVDLVKIDRSFIQNILSSQDDQILVQGVINIAKMLKRKVVAEGVETPEQLSLLASYDCDLVQGYGIAHPMAAAAIENWLIEWRQNNR